MHRPIEMDDIIHVLSGYRRTSHSEADFRHALVWVIQQRSELLSKDTPASRNEPVQVRRSGARVSRQAHNTIQPSSY